MATLKPDSAVPLYRQVTGWVRDWIESGEFGIGGRVPGYRALRAEEAAAPLEAADRLSASGRRAFVVERVLLADGAPVGMYLSYMPLWLVRKVPRSFDRDSLDRGSLYSAFEAVDSVLQRAEEIVEPTILSIDEADKVETEEGSLALRIRRTVYDTDGRPVE